MAFLSGQSIKAALLPYRLEEASEKCEADQIDSLGHGIGIYPFTEVNLGCMSYDLTVGPEAYSLRKAAKMAVSRDSALAVDPGETVLILTQEYIVLSPKYAALTVSRARIMNEGVSQPSAKVDPTWYGRLIVPLTNNTKRTLTLHYQEQFCALLFMELDEPVPKSSFLNRKELPFLGQTTLQYIPRHAVVWQPLPPDKVREEDIDSVVELFGSPFDVVRGAIKQGRERIIEYMEKQWSPSAIRDLKYALWQEEMRFLKGTFWSAVVALFLAVLGWIGAVVFLVVKQK